MKKKGLLALSLLVILVLSLFCGCGGERKIFESVEEFDGVALGAAEGSLYIGYSQELYPNSQIIEYKTFGDVFQALQLGKVYGCMLDEPNFNSLKRTEPDIECFDTEAYTVDIGFGFQKNGEGAVLKFQMDELLAELTASGEIEVLLDKWYGTVEPTDTLPPPDFSNNPKQIRVAIDQTRKPFVYMKNGNAVGFEIEVLYEFCSRYGYKPMIENVAFSSGLAGLESETYDLVAGGLYMTEKRKEKVTFSEPYMHAPVVMVQYVGQEDFFQGLSDGFYATFIEEDRWQLILGGLGMTLLITISSAVLGTLLGFGVYMLCRTFGRIAKGVTKVFTVIMNGTPVVVVLMILYYVIFGRTNISAVIISIFGFTLTTTAFVYEKLVVSVDNIDKGQSEAALAMGFTPNKAFFNVLLPQALKFFMPLYKAEMGALMKATAIVGYISVQDLTKMSDIIRNNAYEAFFPLISTALIYLGLSFLIAQLIQVLINKIEPKNRKKKKILKGVDEL